MTESAAGRGRKDLLAWEASQPRNYYDWDPNLSRVLATRLGAERAEAIRPKLSALGAKAATELRQLGIETNLDENLPRLERYTGLGVRTEGVVFHPSYEKAGRITWESGLLSGYAEPGRETEQLANLWLLAHDGEFGHLCPAACTAGLIKILQQVGSAEQKQRWLPGLLGTRWEERLHASQFITEVQGGSDVGANAVVARKEGDTWRIHGEKWFCSVIDAKLFLMTARPEGAGDGTKGLGVFLVPREVGGETNAFQVRRLKRKLGTRAMASAEADFLGAWADPIGPLDRGFKNVVELVLDTSRVYNAVCCAGAMQRSWLEALGFARHRKAFGRAIAEFPLIEEALATLRAEAMAAAAATFRLLAQGDALAKQGSDEMLRSARRLGVNVNKYWTSVRNTQMARLAMEVLGGNGAIETFSIVPQLYRDAMVLESWEGTHNTLVSQVMRDTAQRGLQAAWCTELSEALARVKLPERDRELVTKVSTSLGGLREVLAQMAEGRVEQRWARRVVDQMAVVQAGVAMLEELAAFPDDEAKRGALQLIAERDMVARVAPPAPLPRGLL